MRDILFVRFFISLFFCFPIEFLAAQNAEHFREEGDEFHYRSEYENAISSYSKAINLEPTNKLLYFSRGNSYYYNASENEQSYLPAINDYSKAISLDEYYWEAYYMRGSAYERTSAISSAIADFKKAIEINPNPKHYKGIYDRLATIYYDQKQYYQAIPFYTEAIKIDPNSDVYNKRAYSYFITGQYDQAIRDYSESINLKPKFTNGLNGRANVYKSIGEYELAVNDYIRIIDLKPESVDAYFDIIDPLSRLHRFQDVIFYNKLVREKFGPDHERFYNYICKCFKPYIDAIIHGIAENKYSFAIKSLEEAEQSYHINDEKENYWAKKTIAAILALKGYVLEKLNRNEEAKDSYNQALAINNVQPEVTEALRELEKKMLVRVQQDKLPPVIELISPQPLHNFDIVPDDQSVQIIGRAKDESGIAEVKINKISVARLEEDGLFISKVVLKTGEQNIEISATDTQGNTAVRSFTIKGIPVVKKDATVDLPLLNIENTPKYHAILIGEKDYLDPALPDLENPIKDARGIAKLLESKYQFNSDNIDTLYNRSREEIMQVIIQKCNTLTTNDNLFIFYAGHGTAVKDRFGDVDGYWIPSSAKKGEEATYISADDIKKAIKRSNAKHILVVTDACFGGGFTRKFPAEAPRSIQKQYALSSRKVMASGDLEPVPDNSKFLYYFKKSLTENTEKYITAKKMFDGFYEAILNNTNNVPQYVAIKNVGDEGGEFVFIKK